MGEYGVHPTRYGEVSDGHLYSMFRESAYARLSESEKLDLLQEVVNRDAMEKGEIGAPEVRFAELPVNESGNAADGVIQVNRDMAVSGVQTFEYKGQTVQHRMDDYNCQTLNTILHENMHCLQDQIIDGTIQIDDLQLTSEYQANSYTNSIVFQNGKGQWGSQYMTGKQQMDITCIIFRPQRGMRTIQRKKRQHLFCRSCPANMEQRRLSRHIQSRWPQRDIRRWNKRQFWNFRTPILKKI